ncbi:tetratricopeptide repeat protein [Desulfopila inferna]|uniref:tetratricopeptide repeat protein n=1 Tax=Desulfopila inferna TaxID=468528 RepID=UPI001962C6DB|nr:tetratricopeptide repeat protein [Desulfopila inferna]MBM9603647.1 tetratricopeptide repeat protein [Desulfopila inferna]
MRLLKIIIVLSALILYGTQAAAKIHDSRAIEADPFQAEQPIAPRLAGLGNYHFPVTTDNPESQEFFNQGLRLTYAFNHSEALRAFKESVRLDHDNAMAYWGWALVLGPNLNLPMMPDVAPQAYEAIQHALQRKEAVSEREQDFIEALAKRYSKIAPEDRTSLDHAYADAMRALVEKYPEDLDAATLYAASLMNLSPWNYWNLDASPRENTTKILNTLQSVVDREPKHAGALHYFIHTVEARHPERGEKHADMLGGLMPGAGHLVHMPSHIYMRVGRFADSYKVNKRAVEADENYITQCRAQGIYPLNYYPHNIHFMAWSAMVMGRPAEALESARKIVAKVPHELSADKNIWTLYETFLSQPVFVMVRFGMWEEMLSEPRPEVESRYMTGVWHYGRALAFLHTGRITEAEKELHALENQQKFMSTLEHYIGFGTAENLLTIAHEIVLGEIAYAEGDTLEGLAHLERAVRLEDSLIYNEPPDWYFPVRHFLGAMLLDAGRPREAEVVYAADLRKNPENGYSLFGLAKALKQQGKNDDAEAVDIRFKRTWADATHVLATSRF